MCKLKLYCKIASNRKSVENKSQRSYMGIIRLCMGHSCDGLCRIVSSISVYDYRICAKTLNGLGMIMMTDHTSKIAWTHLAQKKLSVLWYFYDFCLHFSIHHKLQNEWRIFATIFNHQTALIQTQNTTLYNSMGWERRQISWNKLEI